MPWIAAAIAVFIVGYTFVSLEFRKVNPAYQPYHDLKERGQTHKLLTAGYQRIIIPADLPADATGTAPAPTVVVAGPGGVPPALAEMLFDPPKLPDTYRAIKTAAQINTFLPYTILFDCVQSDEHRQLGGAAIYVRDQTIVIVPEYEQLDGELLARRRDSLVRLTVPAGSIKPGHYQVSLIGARASFAWPLQVN